MSLHKLVLWDLNGCLLDDARYIHQHGVTVIFRRFGLEPPDLATYLREAEPDFMPFYWDRGIPRTETADSLNAIMLESFRQQPPAPFFDDALEALSTLAERGHAQVMVTSYDRTACVVRLRGLNNADGLFREIHGDVRDKRAKFREVLNSSGLDATDAIGISDTVGDAEALRDCGIVPVVVSRGFHDPDYVLAAVPRIPAMIVTQSLRDVLRLPEIQ